MADLPAPVAAFLRGKRFAVAGVSRTPNQTANAVFRKLRAAGYDVVPINPAASEVEGTTCYPNVGSVPTPVDGVVIVTHPRVSLEIVRQCADSGVRHVWFHRSIGQGSVSEEAVGECARRGLECVVGGCPLMYCAPVDWAHRCMRWWLRRGGGIPG
ncbi:MAG: CoA-binding protein [bacterium]